MGFILFLNAYYSFGHYFITFISLLLQNLDLTKQKLIYEGVLNWRMSNLKKLIDVHVLLLEEVIVLLQKQDEKYVLKYYNSTLSPVIKVSTVLVRPNAVGKDLCIFL